MTDSRKFFHDSERETKHCVRGKGVHAMLAETDCRIGRDASATHYARPSFHSEYHSALDVRSLLIVATSSPALSLTLWSLVIVIDLWPCIFHI